MDWALSPPPATGCKPRDLLEQKIPLEHVVTRLGGGLYQDGELGRVPRPRGARETCLVTQVVVCLAGWLEPVVCHDHVRDANIGGRPIERALVSDSDANPVG